MPILRENSMDAVVLAEIENDIYKIKRYVKNGDTILDVGAYTGLFANYAHSLYPNSKILSLEPIAENYSLLTRNVPDSVLTEEVALSHKNGSALIYNFGLESSACHSFFNVNKKGFATNVKTKTLAQIMKDYSIERLNFLKLDCQGAEFNVLTNAKNSVLCRIDYIAMEVHPGFANTKEILGYIPFSSFRKKIMNLRLQLTHKLIFLDGSIHIWKNKKLK